MRNFGISVSQQGKSVDSASDAELVMSSRFNSFKIVKTDVVRSAVATFSAQTHAAGGIFTDSADLVTLNHGLGFVPIVLLFITDSTGAQTQPMPYTAIFSPNSTSGIDTVSFTSYIDSNTLLIQANRYTSAPAASNPIAYSLDYYFRYYLLQETAK